MIQDRTCKTCGAVFPGGPRAYYCPECRTERKKANDARCHQRQREGKTRVGKPDICERCGAEYTVYSGLQRFCKDCQKIHALEYDRATSLDFYRQHRDRINPIRMVRRRKGPAICVVCGKEFKAPTCMLTCSEECRRKRRNLMHRTRYAPRYKRKPRRKTDEDR